MGAFFKNQGLPQKTVERVPKVLKAVEGMFGGIEGWGVVGYCWGGKVGYTYLIASQWLGRGGLAKIGGGDRLFL